MANVTPGKTEYVAGSLTRVSVIFFDTLFRRNNVLFDQSMPVYCTGVLEIARC